jgi:catechol 2,3-dioxygenase-like lactoylglutathione lyase family enzyme
MPVVKAPTVKAHDVAYVRFRAPDLGRMRDFLRDFGLVDAAQTADRLFMRGHGTAPFIHATRRGEPGFDGFGIWLKSLDDLHHLAEAESRPVEPLAAPGGGWMVRLADPDGYTVEAVCGQQMVAPLPVKPHVPWNQGGLYPRQSIVRRVEQGASHVLRLGHVVLGVADFRRSEAWYKQRFGFVTSDEIHPAPDVAIGAFMRCDRGDQPCDHHTLFLLQRPGPPEFMHSAFEVADFDDLMAGHQHLRARDYCQHWGVGRHFLGSQIFDYWRDPWGHEIEHWTDGDRLLAADGGGIATLAELMGVQWGEAMPPIPRPPG